MSSEIKTTVDEILKSVLADVKNKVTGGPVASQSTSDNGNEADKPKDKCEPCCCIKWLVAVPFVLYVCMLALILRYVFSTTYVGANQCIIIVTALILATVVLVLSAVYLLRLNAQCLEAAKEAGKKEEKKVNAPKTYKEIFTEKVQEAVLDQVVKDTVAAFENRI
jgi:hypothetical protein